MNIVWFNHRNIYHPKAGGAERTIYEISKRLVSKKHVVNWYSVSSRITKKKDIIDGIVQNYINTNFVAHLNAPIFLKKFGKDTVVIDDLAHVVPWFSEITSKKKGTVFFRHLHSRTLPGQVNRTQYIILKRIEKNYGMIYKKWPFVTESNMSFLDLVSLGIDEERIVRIPPGVDTNLFKPKQKSPLPEIVFFGRMMDYKQPDHAILAFKAVKKEVPDSHLTLVGDGPALPRINELVRRTGLEKDIDITGRVDVKTLVNLLSKAWVNIHCSVAEGWGYSIMEAAASGTPTIAYNVPGVSEVIRENINGNTVKLNDIEALSNAIMGVLHHSDMFSRNSRKFAEGFPWERSSRMWESHLRKVSDGLYS